MNFSITRRGDYGLIAILYLARKRPEELTQIHEIASHCRLPEPFLAQILRLLVRGGLVQSRKGVHGGFSLARLPEEITFLEVLEALEGPVAVNRCQNPVTSCEHEADCAMEFVWSRAQEALVTVLKEATLKDACASSGFPFAHGTGRQAIEDLLAGKPDPRH
mgnify:FL=1